VSELDHGLLDGHEAVGLTAGASTPEQLEFAGQLKKEFPDAWVHTHISENRNEVRWVQELFPERRV